MRRYIIIDHLLNKGIIDQELYLKIYQYYYSLDQDEIYECDLIEAPNLSKWTVVL